MQLLREVFSPHVGILLRLYAQRSSLRTCTHNSKSSICCKFPCESSIVLMVQRNVLHSIDDSHEFCEHRLPTYNNAGKPKVNSFIQEKSTQHPNFEDRHTPRMAQSMEGHTPIHRRNHTCGASFRRTYRNSHSSVVYTDVWCVSNEAIESPRSFNSATLNQRPRSSSH
jgi:hypothetical protein